MGGSFILTRSVFRCKHFGLPNFFSSFSKKQEEKTNSKRYLVVFQIDKKHPLLFTEQFTFSKSGEMHVSFSPENRQRGLLTLRGA